MIKVLSSSKPVLGLSRSFTRPCFVLQWLFIRLFFAVGTRCTLWNGKHIIRMREGLWPYDYGHAQTKHTPPPRLGARKEAYQ